MMDTTIRVPNDAYPIVVERSSRHIVVRASGAVIAETDRALTLREGDGPVVVYIPRSDVAPNALEDSTTTTYCPYKGDARHFHLAHSHRRIADACWSYEAPYWAVAEIEDHIAFDPDRVDRIELS